MANHSTAYAKWSSTGQYLAVYLTYLTSQPQTVTNERGAPILYRTAEQAEIAAWRAKQAAEERIQAIHLDPGQIKRPAQPKSHAGKRMAAEQVFKIKERT